MNGKGVVKSVLIFTCTVSLIFLVFMLVRTYFENNERMTVDTETMQLVQLEPPEPGDKTAVIDTTLGEMKMVLYPEYSPDAVNNFIELAESGYYDNTYVFDSQEGVYASAGSKEKNGKVSTASAEYENVVRELHQNLWPFRGAVCMLTTGRKQTTMEKIFGGGDYTNGSRFALVNSIEFTDELEKELKDSSESQSLADAFIDKGGVPNFSQQMTIIGQIYEGLDVLDELTKLQTSESEDTGYNVPTDDVIINSIKISTFETDTDNK